MPSERPFPRSRVLDPSQLPRYTVLNVPLNQLDGEQKLVVIACHEGDAAICLKATSKVSVYVNNPDKMAGAVFYRAGEACFQRDTVVQPDNLFAIFHRDIDGDGRVVGEMPKDFHGRLVRAIRESVTLTNRERRELLARIGEAP